ncbi:helix-turn-helix domain-containing protein [Cohnella sp. GCM10020058]|uniref:helix-turn-helix domain-containing protein n=1 Tax=Cohnella sp. GCM10020058 TaxID=3317330 RepID=UPI003643B1F8
MGYSFGGKLKELRNRRGLSLDELAEKVNTKFGTTINKGMISKWENDLGEPRLETAKVIAQFFGVTLDELLGINTSDSPIETIAAHHDGDEWTEEELKAIEAFKELVRSQRPRG